MILGNLPENWYKIYDPDLGLDETKWFVSAQELNDILKLSAKTRKNFLKSKEPIELTWWVYNTPYVLNFNKVYYSREKRYGTYNVVFYMGNSIVYQWILPDDAMEKLVNSIINGEKKIDLGVCMNE